MSTPLLSIENVTKVCGVTTANDDISWRIEKGGIHALIGENGAGKSTLMKILFGLDTADTGRIFWKGAPRPWASPLQAKAVGLSMVHQHFMQAENLTGLEHFALEVTASVSGPRALVPLNRSRLRERAERLAAHYGLPVPWDKPVREMSVGEQQRLEILKALAHPSELLILDEPTAVLAPQEVAPFLERLKLLKAEGKTIILITHKLKEVLSIADTITVLRRGKLVWTGAIGTETEHSLAEKMIGEKLPPLRDEAAVRLGENAGVRIRVRGGRHRENPHRRLGQWDLQLRPGEIVGFAGVDGNGQDELTEMLVHPREFLIDGEVTWDEADLTVMGLPELKARGLAWIPADRLNQAAIREFSALENYVLGREADHSQRGLMRWTEARVELEHDLETFDVRPRETEKIFSGFSGGNQQKVVAAREFRARPKFICACHPTRGIDILAARRIHDKLREARLNGAVTMLVSADVDELFSLCDRIFVLYRGELRLELPREKFSAEVVGRAMAGLQ
ncbi:MAG: ATP-binding cassette domain-containing protein [Bdellovibrionaceae bacterium]|nr:ATP-binding cassette domain-containing protein [Pseudobdellovibrionaceae bacterium]